jgi:hypothetical protein
MQMDWDIFFLKANLMMEEEMLAANASLHKVARIIFLASSIVVLVALIGFFVTASCWAFVPLFWIFGTLMIHCGIELISLHFSMKKSKRLIKGIKDLVFEREQ